MGRSHFQFHLDYQSQKTCTMFAGIGIACVEEVRPIFPVLCPIYFTQPLDSYIKCSGRAFRYHSPGGNWYKEQEFLKAKGRKTLIMRHLLKPENYMLLSNSAILADGNECNESKVAIISKGRVRNSIISDRL